MAAVKHFRLSLVLDSVEQPSDSHGRVLVSRVSSWRVGLPALRLVVRDDGSVWLEQQQESRLGDLGRPWWPVAQLPVLRFSVEPARSASDLLAEG